MTSAAYTHPARLVAVEGSRRLNLVCMGHGSPMVLLEAGLGDSSAVWRKVQASAAARTRVCAYDRAGYGFSDPASHPSDARHAVADLDALLRRANVREPVVLVGHSVGGLYAQLFAATHPQRVAALVLVDPTGLEDFRLGQQVMTDEEATRFRRAHLQRLADIQTCLDLARANRLAPSPPKPCRADGAGDGPLDDVLARQFATSGYWSAYQAETQSFYPSDHPLGTDSVTTAQVREHALHLGNKPLILLKTPGRVPPGNRGENLRAASQTAAVQLVQASRRGEVRNVPSGHYVQLEQPQAVLDAIGDILRMVRGPSAR